MENQNLENANIVIIKTSYTDSQKRAIMKYKRDHKEKISELNKKYYQTRKTDEEYMKNMREKAKQRYHKKKLEKLEEELNKNI